MVSRLGLRLALVALMVVTFFGVWSGSAHAAPLTQLSQLHVAGDHLVNAQNTTVTLRGAELDTPLMDANQWSNDPSWMTDNSWPFQKIFSQMTQSWNMNVVRIPTSPWLWEKYPAYMQDLQTIVGDANADGLYVVLSMHDDDIAGSPYTDCANYPKQDDVTYWSNVAVEFSYNPGVLYDVFNEPNYPTPGWDVWLYGNSGTEYSSCYGGDIPQIYGMPTLINALRLHNAIGVMIVEPGNADAGVSPGDNAETGGWVDFPMSDFNEGNVMFSLHVYKYITDGSGNVDQAALDSKWDAFPGNPGPILGSYPTYYGEWAFLGMGIPDHCPTSRSGGTTYSSDPPEADNDVSNFLTYMDRANTDVSPSNWTAWRFDQDQLLVEVLDDSNIQNYTPSAFPSNGTSWSCPFTGSGVVGMGRDVQNYLLNN